MEELPFVNDTSQKSYLAAEPVSLVVEDLRAFIDGQAPLLSRGKMFIPTDEPQSVVTVAEAELQISSLQLIFRVAGTVISALPKSDHIDGPYGMTIRLTALGEIERRFFDKVILWYNERHAEAPLNLPRYPIEDLAFPIAYPDMMPTEQLSRVGENGANPMDLMTDDDLRRIVADTETYPENLRIRAKRLIELRR